MRRQLQQHAKRAARSWQHENLTTSSWAPFVCANCRRAALQQTHRQTIAVRRSFTTSPPPRQYAAPAEAEKFSRESVLPQTHYDFFPDTFPDGRPPNSSFTPDLRQLRKEFLQLQSKSHPDLASPSQKRQAEALSMRINEAYKTLQDPLRRAQYLLSLRGIDVEDESAKLEENELLMEVMEAREAVEEAEDEDGLTGVRRDNNVKIDESVATLDQAFANGDMDRAAQEAIRLRYWMNIEESIHGWEKGKGGGILHH